MTNINRLAIIVVVGVLAGVAHPAAQQNGHDLFQMALAAERADGNLRQAIQLYERVVQESAADRSLAARALVRMADCYQKLRDDQARSVYERVVRDYADQPAAVAQARADLRNASGRTGNDPMVVRRVWTGRQVVPEGSVSADGRFVSYPAWDTGDLALHDLSTGSDRLLTANGYAGTQYAQGSAISRDGRRVAFAWYNGSDRYELRLMTLPPAGLPEARRLYDNEEFGFLWPFEWSPDDKTIAVWFERKDRTSQIGLVSTADGTMRVLKSLDWRGVERLSFSPDGKYLGFDVAVSDTDSEERDVFVIAVDGSREYRVVGNPGHDGMMGWAPDGATLLFASNRTGTTGLWGVPIANGAAAGAAFPLKADIASTAIGVARSGALFTMAKIGSVDVKTTSVDFGSGKVLSSPESAVRGLIGISRAPDWSPDGTSLAYIAIRGATGRNRAIVVRSLESDQTRELRVGLDYSGQLRWTPDSRAFILKGKDLRGRDGIYRIDAQTGALTQLVALSMEGGNSFPEMSPDGKKLYYWRGAVLRGTPGSRYVERDLATGDERVLFGEGGPTYPSLSPDGRHLIGVVNNENDKVTSLVLVPVMGGESTQVFRAKDFGSLSNYVNWTPDGQSVIVPVRTNGSFQPLIVPVSGGAPRTIDLEIGQLGMKVHPEGRQVAFTVGRAMFELWTLEHFLPASSATR